MSRAGSLSEAVKRKVAGRRRSRERSGGNSAGWWWEPSLVGWARDQGLRSRPWRRRRRHPFYRDSEVATTFAHAFGLRLDFFDL